jgi:hypothetical protein
MYKLNDRYRLMCLGVLLTAGTVFLACSPANPSEADAIKALDAACRQQQNLCKVKSLHKTDGQARFRKLTTTDSHIWLRLNV